MTEWSDIRERYLRDGVPTRLGGLAANLARIGSFSRRVENGDVVLRLVRESERFIEWTESDTLGETLRELGELRKTLADWRTQWSAIWADDVRRAAIGEQATEWSARVLALSGLLERTA